MNHQNSFILVFVKQAALRETMHVQLASLPQISMLKLGGGGV